MSMGSLWLDALLHGEPGPYGGGGGLWSQKHLRGAKSIERRMSTQHLEHSRCGGKLCRMNQ